MDNLPVAKSIVNGWEGGLQFDPHDLGGDTAMGISRKAWPNLPLWSAVDAVRTLPLEEANKMLRADPVFMAAVDQFYVQNFWNEVHGDELPLPMAVAVYDFAVNASPREAIRHMQIALNIAGVSILVDGVVGSKTVKAAWDCGFAAVKLLNVERLMFHLADIQKNPAQEYWARNWFTRSTELMAKLAVIAATPT